MVGLDVEGNRRRSWWATSPAMARQDIVVANAQRSISGIYLGNGDGTFQTGKTIDTAGQPVLDGSR